MFEREIGGNLFHWSHLVKFSAAHSDMVLVHGFDGVGTVRAWNVHTGQLLYGPAQLEPWQSRRCNSVSYVCDILA